MNIPFSDCAHEAHQIELRVRQWEKQSRRRHKISWRLTKLILTGRKYAAHLRTAHILATNKMWQ